MDAPPPIGRRLLSIRKARNLTLCDVQKKSGIAISVLSQIERGKVNPTFSTLWQLTQSLNIEFSELLEHAASGVTRAHLIEHLNVRSTPTTGNRDGTCVFRTLSPTRLVLPVEWYEVHVAGGAHVSASARLDGAREHLTMIRGRLTIDLGDNSILLKEGETARFLTRLPHVIRNEQRQAARALLVVVSPFELQGTGHSHYELDR